MSYVSFEQAVLLLKGGEVAAFPTETVYGLGALATSDTAVSKIYAVKNRPHFNPLILHVSDIAQAEFYGVFSPLAETLAQAFWPGPLTLVLPQKNGSQLSKLATAGLVTVAIRVPAHEMAQKLIRSVGAPLVAPSANPSGRLSATSAQHVEALFNGKVSILEGDVSQVGLESTIVDCTTDQPVILRLGGISQQEIEQVAPGVTLVKKSSPIKAPGMLIRHYAPKLPLFLGQTTPRTGHAFVTFGPFSDTLPTGCKFFSLSLAGDLQEAAANLFKVLHQIDTQSQKFSGIDVMPIPNEGIGAAINDRLTRGASKL